MDTLGQIYICLICYLHVQESKVIGEAEGEVYKNTRVKHEEKYLCDCAPLQINHISAWTFDLVWHI